MANKSRAKPEVYGKFKPCAFAMACGLLWGLSLLITGIVAGCFNWGGHFMKVMSSVYVGYSTGVPGVLLGFVWGFIDGFVGGFIFAWLYNKCLGCAKCCNIMCCCK